MTIPRASRECSVGGIASPSYARALRTCVFDIAFIMTAPQVLCNIAVAGSAYAVFALAFNLVLSTQRFLPVILALPYTLAAYLAFLTTDSFKAPLWIAIALGIIIAAIIGACLETVIFRRLRLRGAEPTIMLLASLGVLAAFQSSISLLFGDQTLVLRRNPAVVVYELAGARIAPVQAASILAAALLFAALYIVQSKSRIGRMQRAVASDPDLARAIGIPLGGVYAGVFAAGSGVVGIGGVLAAADTDLVPTMGFTALLMGIVAAIVGGAGSLPGALLGGLLVGCMEHVSALVLPTQWQDAILFPILLLFLLIRPQGILGSPVKGSRE